MAYRIFNIPIQNSEAIEEELNAFLRSHTVLSVDRRWVDQGSTSFWSFCVDFLDPAASGGKSSRQRSQRPKVDYREVLDEADFAIFAKLRDLRKEIAQADGVPVYAVFNNEQLAKMVQKKVCTKADLEAITGVGDARSEKYGPRFLDFLTQQWAPTDEADGQSI
jgi:superfamily II DNA helicase RecQ